MPTPPHLPPLLDRLTDDEPGEQQEGPQKRVATTRQLRESVVRDLGWLLNCVRLATVQELGAYPRVAKSVLNFGLPDLAGRTSSSIDVASLERQLRQAILDFEPRLVPDSVVVSVTRQDESGAPTGHNQMQLMIEARLMAHPVPLALWLHTQIDLENGEVSISDSSSHDPRVTER